MAAFPLIVVIIAAVFSTAYKHCYQRKLASNVRRLLVKVHAFATEILQLIVFGTGIVYAWSSFASKTIMLDIDTYIISGLDFPVPAWFSATMSVIACASSILAIDLIDNRIQLGHWQHPVQIQTLILTRSSLASWSVKKKRRLTPKKHTKTPVKKQAMKKKNIEPVTTTPYHRLRTTSEPVTPEMLRRFLREIPVEISKSGVLIREARAYARRGSTGANVVTPTKAGEEIAAVLPSTPESMALSKKYAVQSKVEVIERVVGNEM